MKFSIKKLNSENMKKNRAMIATTISLITLFIIIVSALSWGWFAKNKDVSAKSMSISLFNDFATLEYSIYQYEKNIQTDQWETTEETVTDTDGKTITLNMNPYDSIFAEGNTYAPVVIRLGLSGVQIPQSGTITITLNRNTENSASLSKLDDYFSSMIDFGMLIDNSCYGDGNAENILANVIQAPKTLKCFTSKNGNTYSKADSLSFNLPYTENSWNGDMLNAYIYINYNAELANEYSNSKMNDNSTLELDYLIENDISKIQISYH